jgi:condensin complex subunit 2
MQRNKARSGTSSKGPETYINDDSAEKRKRREERVAEKHLERKKVVAAAAAAHGSPIRNAGNLVPISSPRTPNGTAIQAVEVPLEVRKVPVLANFEEWMKMATDNVSRVGSMLRVEN